MDRRALFGLQQAALRQSAALLHDLADAKRRQAAGKRRVAKYRPRPGRNVTEPWERENMKRDWDLVRQQLTDIEEEKDFLADLPDEPEWLDSQSEAEYVAVLNKHRAMEKRIFGHLELLVDNGYVDGLQILRSADGLFAYGLHDPRLTMAGHDLLDTMRTPVVWDRIKTTAKTKGIELTFDAIKALGALALKQLLS